MTVAFPRVSVRQALKAGPLIPRKRRKSEFPTLTRANGVGAQKLEAGTGKASVVGLASLVVAQKLTPAMASGSSLTRGQVASAQLSGDYAIKPENAQPKLDTSQWPLLLKNYDKLLVRSAHFTPIPAGCSPLKRDITTYVK